MTRSDEPPDWALPSWDSLGIGTSGSAAPGAARGAPGLPTPATRLRILGVSDVTRAVRDAIRGDDRLRDVWVEGEVGRVTVSSAGHGYFNLKDERSQLPCVWFRDDRLSSPFEAQVGLRIVAHGRLDVFEPGGAYQLYVSDIQPAGFGDLAIRFEALKARLSAEGLFDRERKRPIPDAARGDRGRHERHGRRPARHPPGARPALAAGPARPVAVPRPGRRGRGEHREGPRPGGPCRRQGDRGRSSGERRRRHDHRPRRRLARGPVGVQRGGRGPGDRRPRPCRSSRGSATRRT